MTLKNSASDGSSLRRESQKKAIDLFNGQHIVWWNEGCATCKTPSDIWSWSIISPRVAEVARMVVSDAAFRAFLAFCVLLTPRNHEYPDLPPALTMPPGDAPHTISEDPRGPGPEVRMVMRRFYREALFAFEAGDKDKAFNIAYWLLYQAETPVMARAGARLILAESPEFSAYHARNALELYTQVRDQYSETGPPKERSLRADVQCFVDKAEYLVEKTRDTPDLPPQQPSEEELHA
ncbi:uncharacterized protein B0I36DRAFT_349504 [Microdochium trichocladiopsis]|uniref:Uncharacterized protein n=1 Tax=Microdochium trichocladiopsis TaxID=1682393 RepID=A0A9P9BNN9_9PEZI|nr:uncharacterized protein B0I36DRAFT_349504 [Microdochium trichocladiopsis]KAH7031426.1 hypothetical protein B0I36DRAFT_349504 [Microdochium trichocladiopsis]